MIKLLENLYQHNIIKGYTLCSDTLVWGSMKGSMKENLENGALLCSTHPSPSGEGLAWAKTDKILLQGLKCHEYFCPISPVVLHSVGNYLITDYSGSLWTQVGVRNCSLLSTQAFWGHYLPLQKRISEGGKIVK